MVATLAVDDLDMRYDPAAERIFDGTAASARHVVNGVVFFPLMVEDRIIEVEL
jgi:hypothetical protein